jgi:transcriptional regulator with XRE-family HTH domain
VDVCLVIKQRLDELGFEQKDLAAAAQVTESYVSQLLTRKKLPPAPDRTDIYEKIGSFLKLPSGKLANLADAQRREEFKRGFEDPPAPLFAQVRELILRKCAPAGASNLRKAALRRARTPRDTKAFGRDQGRRQRGAGK